MDFADDDLAAFSLEVEQFLRRNVGDEELRRIHRSGDGYNAEVHRLLADRGWVAGPWPREYGGQGWDALQVMAFRLGLRRGGYAAILQATTTFVGHVLLHVGTDFQKRHVLPSLASGNAIISLGYTEPESGSDVMAARTRAVRDGDEWVIDGSKMFSTGAHLATYCFLLTRTDPEAPKHRGLTMFLVPLDRPGITINPVRTMADERSNAVFYNGVRIEDKWRVGEVNGGTSVLAIALQVEQGTSFVNDLEALYDQTVEWAHATRDREGAVRMDAQNVRDALAELRLDIEISTLLLQQGVWRGVTGAPDLGRGPMSKLFSSERLIHHTEVILDLMGPDGMQKGSEAERLYRFAPGTTIYGGTSEILRSRIAEAGLGLARSRR